MYKMHFLFLFDFLALNLDHLKTELLIFFKKKKWMKNVKENF